MKKIINYTWSQNETNERFVIIEKFEHNKFDYDYQFGFSHYFYDKSQKKHRENGNPAVYNDRIRLWYKKGKLHRKDGKPAIIRQRKEFEISSSNDIIEEKISLSADIGIPIEEYWVNGNLHRENDLPAVIFNDVNIHLNWFKNGKLHREKNKPSIINGNFFYYHNDGELYKSEIVYNSKITNWIINNPFMLSGIIFIIGIIIISLI